MQAEELCFAALRIEDRLASLQSYYWGQLPGPDGTIPYFHRETRSLIKLPVTGYTACGAPIYDIAHPVIVRVEGDLLGGGNGEGMLLGGRDGRVYLNQDPILAEVRPDLAIQDIQVEKMLHHMTTVGRWQPLADRIFAFPALYGFADVKPVTVPRGIHEIFPRGGNGPECIRLQVQNSDQRSKHGRSR